MTKIGSGNRGHSDSGPNRGSEDRVARQSSVLDPFSRLSKPLDRSADTPGVSWESASRQITEALAAEWFSRLNPISLGEYLAAFSARYPDSVASNAIALADSMGLDLSSTQVFPQMLQGAGGLGQVIPLAEAALFSDLQKVFAKQGVFGSELSLEISGGLVTEGDAPTLWLGGWGSDFGSRVFVGVEVLKATDGTEWLHIFTTLIISTRMVEPLGEVMTRFIQLPQFMPRIFFIAETPFPSQLFSMDRSIAYPEVPDDLHPVPLVSLDSPGLATFTRGQPDTSGALHHEFGSYPSVMRAGFAVSQNAVSHFDHIIPHIVDSCVRMATIVEDGFRNYRGETHPASFDRALGSEYVYFSDSGAIEGKSTAGFARWVPETQLGTLIHSTEDAANAANFVLTGTAQRDTLEWAAYEGAGDGVASAINTLCFSYLIPEGRYEEAERLLLTAVELDVINESTNALSNLGQLYRLIGDTAAAKDALLEALSRDDRFSEGEARLTLALIALDEGDLVGAKGHLEKGAQAEGPSHHEFAAKCEQLLKQHFAEARYCQACGGALPESSKFCPSCGSVVAG